MRERDIEIYLRDQVKKAGGKAYKFESPGNDGVPDRIVVFPGSRIYFVELKAPDKKPRPLQVKQMNSLKSFGCNVLVIDSKEGVNDFIQKAEKDYKMYVQFLENFGIGLSQYKMLFGVDSE